MTPPRKLVRVAPRAPKEPMVQRNLRVPSALWDAAAEKGASEDPPRGISDIVRDLLAAYVAKR